MRQFLKERRNLLKAIAHNLVLRKSNFNNILSNLKFKVNQWKSIRGLLIELPPLKNSLSKVLLIKLESLTCIHKVWLVLVRLVNLLHLLGAISLVNLFTKSFISKLNKRSRRSLIYKNKPIKSIYKSLAKKKDLQSMIKTKLM